MGPVRHGGLFPGRADAARPASGVRDGGTGDPDGSAVGAREGGTAEEADSRRAVTKRSASAGARCEVAHSGDSPGPPTVRNTAHMPYRAPALHPSPLRVPPATDLPRSPPGVPPRSPRRPPRHPPTHPSARPGPKKFRKPV
ncbi:hypothetical protein KPATCC21470_3501 [Kitasatospora purpeofusca]